MNALSKWHKLAERENKRMLEVMDCNPDTGTPLRIITPPPHVIERRKTVAAMLSQGVAQKDIAEATGVSRQMISQDVAAIKRSNPAQCFAPAPWA